MEETTHVGAYGTACGCDRRLKTDAAAKGYGEGGGNERGVHIAWRQLALVSRDGEEHTGDAVTDVALDDIANKEDSEQYADEWGDEDKYVAPVRDGVGVAKGHHHLARKVDDSLEQYCRQTAEYAHDDA